MRPSRPQLVSHSSASSQRSQRSFRHVLDPLDDPRVEPFKLPRTHHLIITTSQGVYTCGTHGITEIFRSGSNGIVAAKRATNGSRVLLAVADDQLVILHDTANVQKGMRRSYRLKSEDGRIRTLRFAKDPDRLYFTTTLQDAVQAYDLEHARLLDPVYHHPSPPTVFALSSTSHLLLSASAHPPLVQLTNFLLNSRSLLLRPQCSSAAVVVAEFHPERGNIFVLAFADATCAVYDAAYIFPRGNRGGEARRKGAGCEIAHIKNLHAFERTTSPTFARAGPEAHTVHSPRSTSDGFLEEGEGIRAVGFVPGHKTLVVTVGSDSRCCVVDFAASEAHTASLIRTWDITGKPTSLSVLTPSAQAGTELPIAGLKGYYSAQNASVIAIGSEDGKVTIFDLDGNLLSQQTPESSGRGILDVEWLEGDDWPVPSQHQHAENETSKRRSGSQKKSKRVVLAGDRPIAEELVAVADSPDKQEASGKALMKALPPQRSASATGEVESVPTEGDSVAGLSSANNHLYLPSILQTLYPVDMDHKDISAVTDTSSSASFETMVRDFQFPVPPRHLEPPGKSSRRRGQTPLPRNNSWAADAERRNAVLGEGSLNAPTTTQTYAKEGLDEPASRSERTRPLSPTPFTSSDGGLESNSAEVIIEHDPNTQTMESIDQAATYQDDQWDDIPVEDSVRDQPGGSGTMGKENNPGNEASYAVNMSKGGPSTPKSEGEVKKDRLAGKGKQPGVPFAIHIDEPDKTDHPQPLSAHPEKSPSSGPRPLRPINVNSPHPTSAVRTPWHRQRYKNGHIESHRSSIYGPGALARKVQQEVMITVNFELDVLRREMSEKFAAQSRWFEKELRNSQEWTLRVEEENRKLREELAKERRRKVVIDRTGARTLC